MGKLTGQKLKPRHFLLFYPGFTVVGLMLRNQVFKHRFFFSKQTRKPADKRKQRNILQQYIFIMSLNSDPEKGSSSLVE